MGAYSISSQRIFFIYLPGSSVCDVSPTHLSICMSGTPVSDFIQAINLLISVISNFECVC